MLFKSDLNNQWKLKWVTEEPSTEASSLDLVLQTDRNKGKLSKCTYQMSFELFLYKPVHSLHPPGLMKSLITGILETYWKQNSKRFNCIQIASLLHKKLLARGHKAQIIDKIFKMVVDNIKHKLNTSTPTTSTTESKSV